MTLTEKVAYLKGLKEGIDLSAEPMKEKFITGLLELLEEMALTVNEIDEDLADAEEYIEEVDEALADVESEVYDLDDDCTCSCGCGPDCDCDPDCECGCNALDNEMYEVECPSCGETLYLDEDMFEEEYIECPSCGEKLELDIEFDDCDCDCECGCDCDDE